MSLEDLLTRLNKIKLRFSKKIKGQTPYLNALALRIEINIEKSVVTKMNKDQTPYFWSILYY